MSFGGQPMNNCINVPEELLEAMLDIAWQYLDQDQYRKKFGGINWVNPKQAGPAWQDLLDCFGQVSSNQGLPRPKETIESIIPLLNKYGLTLSGNKIVRVS